MSNHTDCLGNMPHNMIYEILDELLEAKNGDTSMVENIYRRYPYVEVLNWRNICRRDWINV